MPASFSFPGAPGTAWPTATHTLVITETGARYLFREHARGAVYASSSASSSGTSLDNVLVDVLPSIVVGQTMAIRYHRTTDGLVGWVISSPVAGWERWDLMTGCTSTSVDDMDEAEVAALLDRLPAGGSEDALDRMVATLRAGGGVRMMAVVAAPIVWLPVGMAPACPLPRHQGMAWQVTACLCECHYGEAVCDDLTCQRIAAWEARDA